MLSGSRTRADDTGAFGSFTPQRTEADAGQMEPKLTRRSVVQLPPGDEAMNAGVSKLSSWGGDHALTPHSRRSTGF